MGKPSVVFVAAVQYSLGYSIFTRADVNESGPFVATITVWLAVGLLLWELPLYPTRLRQLPSWSNRGIQYLIAVFLFEHIMACFWFPLEATVIGLWPKLADQLEQNLLMLDISVDLKKEGTAMFMSYLLSFWLLLVVLHATRIINLQLLFTSPRLFFEEIKQKVQSVVGKISSGARAAIGGGARPNTRRRRGGRTKPTYCYEDEDFEFAPCYDTPTSDTEYHHRRR